MKKLFIYSLVALLMLGVSASTYAQDKKETKKETKTESKPGKPVNSICPVSGEEVDGEITATYNGKTYAVCCKKCLRKFNKEPETYIKKLSPDGKSLIKE